MSKLQCKVCELECNDDNALVCDQCGENVHFKCSRLPLYVIVFLEMSEDQTTYCCEECAQDLEKYSETQEKIQREIDQTSNGTRPSTTSTSKSHPSSLQTPKAMIVRENNEIEKRLKNIDTTANENMEKQAVCHFYRHNRCKHGKKGKDCSYRHPVVCRDHIRNHSKCKEQKKCQFWHPQLCKYGLSCRSMRCRRFHVPLAGHKRNTIPKNYLRPNTQRLGPTSRPWVNRQSQQARSGNSSNQLIALLTDVLSLMASKT